MFDPQGSATAPVDVPPDQGSAVDGRFDHPDSGKAIERALMRTSEESVETSAPKGPGPDSPVRSTSHLSGIAAPVTREILPPSPRQRVQGPVLLALQEWEGYVTDIYDDEFVARLTDLTAGRSHETEESDIPLAEISENDAARMQIGSIFRWVIGYERSSEGTRRRVSQIVFRDLPQMTKSDFCEGEAWAQEMAQWLGR